MKFLDEYFKYEIGTEISGLTNELNVFYVDKLSEKYDRNIIVLTSSLFEANKIYDNLVKIHDNTLLFPMDDFLSSMLVASSPELKYKRLETLDKLKSGNKYIIVTNLMGYLKYLPSASIKNYIDIKKNDIIKRDDLVKEINNLGYHRESLVTMSGEYAVRGFILDLYPIDYVHPVRIEFDGNVIDNIKYFDSDTVTNSSPEFIISELIREKVLELTDEEVPHSVTCIVDELYEEEKIINIGASIIVDRENLKKIIIGKNGNMIKEIGIRARKDIEEYFGKQVYLDLFVKVIPKWRDKEKFLNMIGYKDFLNK